MSVLLSAVRRAALIYLVLGLIVVSGASASFAPLHGHTWQERSREVGLAILTWPRLLPEAAAAALDLPLSNLE